MAGTYAKTTKVPVRQSRDEIEKTLTRYGADQFAYGWSGAKATIAFRADGRFVRFTVAIPESPQEERQRWRALLLVIKAKLEAVDSGIATFEEEFLAHILLPSGRTVGDEVAPAIETAYETGESPPLLGPGSS